MALPQVRTKSILLKGGLDLETPALSVGEGFALEATNIEPNLMGGYRRIAGYERIAGGKHPSDAEIVALYVDDAALEAIDTDVTGSISGATGKIVAIDASNSILGLTNVVGDFVDGDMLSASTVSDVSGQHPDPVVNNQWLLSAGDYYRGLVPPLPTSQIPHAVQRYGGRTYALSDQGLYVGSANSWVLIPANDILKLTNITSEILKGEVLDGATSSATGTVARFIKQGGSYGSDAYGYVVITSVSGVFVDGEDINESATLKATADGTQSLPSLTVPIDGLGIYKIILNNFTGNAHEEMMYFCIGNRLFEFSDEDWVITPVLTGTTADITTIEAHKNHLFVAFEGGGLLHSGVGLPLIWNVVLGAGQIDVGDEIKSLESSGSDTLIIATDRNIKGLQGSSSLNWGIKLLANNISGIGDTLKTLNVPTLLTPAGIIKLSSTDLFGVFESSSVSRRINPLLKDWLARKTVVGARVDQGLNQYKVYFKDGSGIIMAYDALFGVDELPQFTTFQYDVEINCVSSEAGGNGQNAPAFFAVEPRIPEGERDDYIFGGRDGYIYQENKGDSFDGDAIPYVLKLPFHHLGSPIVRKSFKWVDVGIDSDFSKSLALSYELSGGQYHTAQGSSNGFTLDRGYTPFWGVAQWGEFAWGGAPLDKPQVSLSGTGTDISLLFYGAALGDSQFTINSLTYSYLPRRLLRG